MRTDGVMVHDAVHGPIYFNSREFFTAGTWLERVFESPEFRRLKRIGLLPFASSDYLAANHTRYSHAVGTAHIMMCLLRQLRDSGYLGSPLLGDIRQVQIQLGASDIPTLEYLGNHFVLAGLLQDLGELPFNTATDLFFFPDYSLRESLIDDLGPGALHISDKDVFTLHATKRILKNLPDASGYLSFHFLAYLISGLESPSFQANEAIRRLRTLVDGPVDADRLDYAYRDRYHTLGSASGSTAHTVIASLIGLHEAGPIFDSAGPVSDFILLRALLRVQVYSSPEARFRYTLMAKVLSDAISRSPEWVGTSLGALRGSLSFESFLGLDDHALINRLDGLLQQSGPALVSPMSRDAIRILQGEKGDYRYFWLDEPRTAGRSRPRPQEIERLPSDVLVDTYWDEERHRLYKPASILVDQSSYSLSATPVPLEETGGHIGEILHAVWDSPPISGKILLFLPSHRTSWLEAQMSSDDSLTGVYEAALERDASVRLGVDDDTRAAPGFMGPSIFVSFSWSEINLTRSILRILNTRKRRYLAFVTAFKGIASDTRANGQTSAASTDSAIVVLSLRYLAAARDPNSNIYAELLGLAQGGPKPVVFLAADAGDEFDEALPLFPWRLLGYTSPPYMGAVLSPSNVFALERAVDAALQYIDKQSTED